MRKPLLRRKAIPCELRLGARADSGPFGAHAWVQCAGIALNEDAANLAHYRSFGEAVVPVGRSRAWRHGVPRGG